MGIGKKMAFGFGILLSLTAVLAVVVLINVNNMTREYNHVAAHSEISAKAKDLLKFIVDMETGQRGFVITGREEFLEPYSDANERFRFVLDQLKALVDHNPDQLALLDSIEQDLNDWKRTAAEPEIAMGRRISTAEIDAEYLQEMLSQEHGKGLMDEFMAKGHVIETAFRDAKDWEGAFYIEIIERCIADREDAQRVFLITGEESSLEKYHRGEQLELPVFFARLREIVIERGRTQELMPMVDEIETLAQRWIVEAAEPEIAARREMNKHPETLSDVAELLVAGTGKRLLDKMRDSFDVFLYEEERIMWARRTEAHQASAKTINTTIVVGISSLIVGAMISTFMTRGITKPVGKLSKAVRLVAQGDLSQQIERSTHDEIGALSESFNTMVVQLSNLRDERALAAASLREALETADSANRAKSDFLANMSHEIRTPMTAIVGFAENMLDPSQTEEERVDSSQTICRNGAYLLELIDDILDISKIEAGKMNVEMRDCSICNVVADVASLMRVRSDARGLELQYDYDGPIPKTIKCDPTRLRQILINLIGNAIKFTETGSVTLRTRFVEDGNRGMVEFDVIDTGCGLTSDQVTTLFQPFAQADSSTTRKYGGTGLGLTISRRFARLLGGDITIAATAPGFGTTIRVSILAGDVQQQTMLDDPATATVIEDLISREDHGGRVDLQDKRILLAEDGLDNQRLIAFVLKKVGADVTLVENGQLAYDAVMCAIKKGHPFDVILMDMQMPVLDGYETTRRLRSSGYQGPIIALTANAMNGDRSRCVDAGCTDYASKPIDRIKLVRMISEYSVAA